jgi:hypothetical protein
MSFKSAMAAATLMALASLCTLSGCAGDECVKAADHVEECAPLTASSTATAGGDFDSTAACEGLYLCQSQCTNNANCASVKAVFGGRPVDGSEAYQKCLDKCKTTAN